MKSRSRKIKASPVYETIEKHAKREIKKGSGAKDKKIDIGATVLKIRKAKGFRGVEVCRKAGDLDPKTLSALEKGRIKNPTIRTLQSVSKGLGISISDIFDEAGLSKDKKIYRGTQKGAYQVQFASLGIKAVSFTPFIGDFFCGKLLVGPKKTLEQMVLKHPAPIYLSPLIGRFEVEVEGERLELREGENIFFDGRLKHSIHNPLRKESVLMVITAPSFFQ